MSGIAGIIHFDDAPVEPGLIEKMTAAMGHRGPDGIRHWVKGSVALGQCMLCTTPESLEETQPLTSEDESLVLVMDGRVDNWEELRQALLDRDARLRDRSDAELILRSYETWGEDCLRHIDGDFALIIWNACENARGVCARDLMEENRLLRTPRRRLVFRIGNSHAVAAGIRIARLQQRRHRRNPADRRAELHSDTLSKEIVRLPPACLMTVRMAPRSRGVGTGTSTVSRNYVTSPRAARHNSRQVHPDAVRRRLRSASPVGVYVSGGLDSSAVLCVALPKRPTGEHSAVSLQHSLVGVRRILAHRREQQSRCDPGYLFPFLPPRGEVSWNRCSASATCVIAT